jgi:hypothetical protein
LNLLETFEFSQSSLQDFIDCRRRFQLRYLERVSWPAVQAEPIRENEQHILRGERFHRLAQQYLLGIPAYKLSRMAAVDDDEHLQEWWENFLAAIPSQLDGQKHIEETLSAPLGRFRLLAKYDLVVLNADGNAVIYDWKTSTRRPKRTWLASRMQTKIYPYLLRQAGATLRQGHPLSASQISMVYWFAGPDQPAERFEYTEGQFEHDHNDLLNLVNEIGALQKEQFTLTTDEAACRFCVYRSLCERGTQGGDLSLAEDELTSESARSLDFSLEQIGEISF